MAIAGTQVEIGISRLIPDRHFWIDYFQSSLPKPVLDTVPDFLLVLNAEREIVYASRKTYEVLNLTPEMLQRGIRPGNALDCASVVSGENECGGTPFCAVCGAYRAIVSSLQGMEDVQECRILRRDGSALDFQVWSKPLEVQGTPFSVVAFKDISSDKRRRALERIFFHDILNTAGVLTGFANLLKEADEAERALIYHELEQLSRRLVDEIQSQKRLLEAEIGDLQVQVQTLRSRTLLAEVVSGFEALAQNQGCRLILHDSAEDVEFLSDSTLLWRILSNLIKNALEASHPGQVVTVACGRVASDALEFQVHNESCMSRDVQLQVFKRYFSTKDVERGLGTYSVKLLTERYLKGSVDFVSQPGQGTTFFARYPLEYPLS